MKQIILTKGLPASGKSTWAKEWLRIHPNSWKRINKDDLRAMLDDSRWSKQNEKFVLTLRDAVIKQALRDGFSVIVDDTNLHPRHELRMNEIVEELQGEGIQAVLQIKTFFDVSLDECIARDLKRPNSVGERVIRNMYNQFVRPKPPIIKRDPALPDCIVCDIDGTLALFGDASPYDRDFSQDQPNPAVMNVLAQYKVWGDPTIAEPEVIFLSGRMDKFRMVTEEWLGKWLNWDEYKLYMRKTDDLRKDFIIKKELYEEHIKGKYNVLFMLDDRNQVVDMWRSEGLTVFQVAEGDF